MAQVLVRNLSDRAVAALKDRARRNGTSLEQELRELIERHIPYDPAERLAAVRTLRASIREDRP